MRAKVFRYVKITGALLCVSLLTFFAVRIYDTQRGLPLEPWHTHVPRELGREKLDAANWTQYLAAEAGIFDDVQRFLMQTSILQVVTAELASVVSDLDEAEAARLIAAAEALREAKRVIDAVVEHISTRPNESLGVVTLNIKQRDLLAELLEERLNHPHQCTILLKYYQQIKMAYLSHFFI